MKVVGPWGRTWDSSIYWFRESWLWRVLCIQQTFRACALPGERAVDEKDLVSDEEGFLRSSTLKTPGYDLKELDAYFRAIMSSAKKCDTDCNPSRQRGLVTGLTFRKQSMLLYLLWNINPQPITRLKRVKLRQNFPRKRILHRLLATHLCHCSSP